MILKLPEKGLYMRVQNFNNIVCVSMIPKCGRMLVHDVERLFDERQVTYAMLNATRTYFNVPLKT